jgi:hypothetical protein
MCLIVSHQFGLELRLPFGSKAKLLRSQVCQTDEEILTTGGEWKAALLEKRLNAIDLPTIRMELARLRRRTG